MRLSSLRLVRGLDLARLGDAEGLSLLGNRTTRAFVFSLFLLTYPAELRLRLLRWCFLNGRCCRVVLCFLVFCGVALGALVNWGRPAIWLVRRPLSVH